MHFSLDTNGGSVLTLQITISKYQVSQKSPERGDEENGGLKPVLLMKIKKTNLISGSYKGGIEKMARKGLFTALVFMLASAVASAGGLEPGSASGALEIGGYADVLYTKYDTTKTTFVLGHFVLDAAAELGDDVVVAAELEWARSEPNALSAAAGTDGALVCAYVDYAILEPLVLRAGKFLVPFNVYNDRLYPADVAKLATVPFMNLSVVPTKWAETGIQIHGSIDTGTAAGMDYAIYLVNGLEGAGGIASMKNNDVDSNDSNKAVGTRIAVTTPVGFEAGLSYYMGAYTADGNSDLTLLGLDACYEYEAFQIRAEYVSGDVEGAAVEDRDGFYLQGAYKFLDKYEAVLRYDEMDVTGSSIDRFTLGGNYTITDDLTFRLSYEWSDAAEGDGVVGQLAVRF